MAIEKQKIKKLFIGPNFEDDEGNVRSNADLTEDMEFEPTTIHEPVAGELLAQVEPAADQAVRGLANNRRRQKTRRAHSEPGSAEIGRAIDAHIAAREKALGYTLTDEQYRVESLFAEQHERGIL